MSKWFCLKKKSKNESPNTTSTTIPSSLESDLNNLNITEERMKRYADEAKTLSSSATLTTSVEKDKLRAKAILLREKAVSKTLDEIKRSLEVDLCFVLDCTASMSPHIAAAKDCILQVSNHVKHTNPSIKLRVGFCGYRDHDNGPDRLQTFNFTDKCEDFASFLRSKVGPISNGDYTEDVLGGLNAAITQMDWQNSTRVLLHIGDCPPHGRRFSSYSDKYPDGDPYGLTAESVLENMQLKNILYFFGKITAYTDLMLKIFRDIIGEFPVFDLVGDDPTKLIDKFVKATSTSITMAVSLTSTLGSNSKDIYSLQRKKLNMDVNEPNWNDLPSQKGVTMWHCIPETLEELKNSKYFNKSNLFSKSFSFKIASLPFSAGVERYAYFALDTKSKPAKNMVIKEYLRVGQCNPFEKYLEAVEVSTVAYFLASEFNSKTEKKNIPIVNFLHAKLLRTGTIDRCTRYYTIEPKLEISEYKRFNSNTGIITELRPTLEAFCHFTYEYTKGYLVVCDLQGVELADQFLLTDPAIHCTDYLRFGRTNFGKAGITQCFLEKHKCNDVCKKLKLSIIK